MNRSLKPYWLIQSVCTLPLTWFDKLSKYFFKHEWFLKKSQVQFSVFTSVYNLYIKNRTTSLATKLTSRGSKSSFYVVQFMGDYPKSQSTSTSHGLLFWTKRESFLRPHHVLFSWWWRKLRPRLISTIFIHYPIKLIRDTKSHFACSFWMYA